MPELVAFIPDCCVIAVVFKFLLSLYLMAHYFFLTFFPFPLPTPSRLQTLPLGSRSPAPPPPRERVGRFLATVSWETKNLHPCDLLHRGITLLTLVILTNNLERNILIFFSRPRREIINLFVSCDLLFFSLVIFLLRIYLRYVFVVPKWNMLNHIVFFLHESI